MPLANVQDGINPAWPLLNVAYAILKTMKMSDAQKKKIAKVMGEYKRGTLHAGIDPKGKKKAPLAKTRKQAIAIALSQAGVSRS